MDNWFTIDHIDKDTHIISEYRHWEETHAYLLNGTERSLLIDNGLGICNIYDEAIKLTDKPVTDVATHIHLKKVFPAHRLNIHPEILIRMHNAFRQLESEGKLHYGSGTFKYKDFVIWM